MNGTTTCPHCHARFRIADEQLGSHHGMVRCGQCMKPFNARVTFVPDELDTRVELPILDNHVAPASPDIVLPEPTTLAEQVTYVKDEATADVGENKHRGLWAAASSALFVLLLAQACYYFRIDLAARLPVMKPALLGYCEILGCKVPLPRHTDLIAIESSDMQFDPANERHIFLSALLFNRASYAQALPNLELTLNDSLDVPLARRVFVPADYLSPKAGEVKAMQPGLELPVNLHLDTGNLKPAGYRIAIYYPHDR